MSTVRLVWIDAEEWHQMGEDRRHDMSASYPILRELREMIGTDGQI